MLPANQVFITEQGPECRSRPRPPGCEGPCAPRADNLPGFILWGAGVSLMSVMWDLGSGFGERLVKRWIIYVLILTRGHQFLGCKKLGVGFNEPPVGFLHVLKYMFEAPYRN